MPEPKWKRYYSEEDFIDLLSDPERYEELKELYSPSKITKWRNRFGIDLNMRKFPWVMRNEDPELVEELLWDYEVTTLDIAKELDVSESSVKAFCKYHDIEIPPSHYERWKRYFTPEEMNMLMAKGLPGFRVIQRKTDYSKDWYHAHKDDDFRDY